MPVPRPTPQYQLRLTMLLSNSRELPVLILAGSRFLRVRTPCFDSFIKGSKYNSFLHRAGETNAPGEEVRQSSTCESPKSPTATETLGPNSSCLRTVRVGKEGERNLESQQIDLLWALFLT